MNRTNVKMIKKNTKKKKPSFIFFALVFTVLAVLIIVQNYVREKTLFLSVSNNAGVTVLDTVDNHLVCVFHDGQTAVWDWNQLAQPQADFSIQSNRAVIISPEAVASVNETGRKMLTVYDLSSGEKQKDMAVGHDDQQVWPRISPDKTITALIRKNAPDSAGSILYEFMTLDIERELLGLPVALDVQEDSQGLVDYAVDSTATLYAVGAADEIGRLAALNLENGNIIWDRTYGQAEEFCSVMVDPTDHFLLAGSRAGLLYKINAGNGELIKTIQLLEEGETRPVTNDYSVLNPAFSPDGQYYVVTINPKAYLLKTDSDKIIYICTPADRLVSKIAFSPENRYFATSDLRAGYPVKVWPMPQNE